MIENLKKGHLFKTNSDTEVLIKVMKNTEKIVSINLLGCGHLQFGTKRKQFFYLEIISVKTLVLLY